MDPPQDNWLGRKNGNDTFHTDSFSSLRSREIRLKINVTNGLVEMDSSSRTPSPKLKSYDCKTSTPSSPSSHLEITFSPLKRGGPFSPRSKWAGRTGEEPLSPVQIRLSRFASDQTSSEPTTPVQTLPFRPRRLGSDPGPSSDNESSLDTFDSPSKVGLSPLKRGGPFTPRAKWAHQASQEPVTPVPFRPSRLGLDRMRSEPTTPVKITQVTIHKSGQAVEWDQGVISSPREISVGRDRFGEAYAGPSFIDASPKPSSLPFPIFVVVSLEPIALPFLTFVATSPEPSSVPVPRFLLRSSGTGLSGFRNKDLK